VTLFDRELTLTRETLCDRSRPITGHREPLNSGRARGALYRTSHRPDSRSARTSLSNRGTTPLPTKPHTEQADRAPRFRSPSGPAQ
jgi:hypothetical protein